MFFLLVDLVKEKFLCEERLFFVYMNHYPTTLYIFSTRMTFEKPNYSLYLSEEVI